MSFEKILVPYDGSQYADKAFENAIEIARMSGTNTQVILLHVTPDIPIPLTFERPVYSTKTQYIQELTEEMEENASKMHTTISI